MRQKNEKQPEENIELVKEAEDSKRNYIFKKNWITKTGFVIIVLILILVIVGIVFSGLYFETSMEIP